MREGERDGRVSFFRHLVLRTLCFQTLQYEHGNVEKLIHITVSREAKNRNSEIIWDSVVKLIVH